MVLVDHGFDKVFENIEIGIGTWAWGDRMVWGFGNGYTEKDIEAAFTECVESGVTFFDTAEVYGQGRSERILGKLLKQSDLPIRIASKMMPFPWRLGKNAHRKAVENSLKRLDIEKIDLYQMHWPMPPVAVTTWMDRLADLVKSDLIGSIGVSNYDLEKTRASHNRLKEHGLRLASNQVEYHLLERRIEKNGLMDYCQQEGIKIIAYSPLAMGILTGKYTPENPPRGARASQYNRGFLEKIQPLLKTMKRIGANHDGKTASQVAINWVICKNALPIPGVKTANQASQNVEALGWRLEADEVAMLDELSDKVGK